MKFYYFKENVRTVVTVALITTASYFLSGAIIAGVKRIANKIAGLKPSCAEDDSEETEEAYGVGMNAAVKRTEMNAN